MAGIIRTPGARSLAEFGAALRERAARFEADAGAIIDREGTRGVREIKRQWPDRGKPGWLAPTGASKARWVWEKIGKLQWRTVNTAAYASHIHPPRNPVRLVDSVVKPTTAKVETRIRQGLAALLANSTQGGDLRRASGRILL